LANGNGDTWLRVPEAGSDGATSELTTANVLRLLSAGASGSILMALAEGPLRTKELTERIPGYAPRTIYRYAIRLAEIGVIERDEEPGVPSKVVHTLTDPCGRELYELINAYANTALGRLPSGEIGAPEWASLALLADFWESGMIEELNRGPRSLTELSRGQHGLSFHQVNRRAGLFMTGGFIEEVSEPRKRRRYGLAEKTRRAMLLIAGIGRWRRRHIVPKGATGLTAGEVRGLMQTALPLVVLSDHPGKSLEMRIAPVGENGAGEELVWADVGADGALATRVTPNGTADGSAHGKVPIWVDSVLDGPHNGLRVKGDEALIVECLRQLHARLWTHSKKG
jgi:DNA-binding HxlR family transcriptional regulator